MLANLKIILEVVRLVLDALRFLKGEISEHQYSSAIKKRKERYDVYTDKTKTEKERLEALRDIE